MSDSATPWTVGISIPCYNSFLFFKNFIYFNWRLITLQYCSGFCHGTLYKGSEKLHTFFKGMPGNRQHSYSNPGLLDSKVGFYPVSVHTG